LNDDSESVARVQSSLLSKHLFGHWGNHAVQGHAKAVE
jgi:hypothetical protein